MEIHKEDLVAILDLVRPAVASNEMIEQATNFIFNKNEILAYNAYILISYPFETDLKCTVDANLLYKLSNRMNSETINLDFNEDHLECWNDKTVAKIPIHIESEVFGYIRDVTKTIEKKGWKPISADFLEALRQCAFAASKYESDGAHTVIRVEDKWVSAGTGFKIAMYEMDSAVDESFYIKAPFLIELSKYEGISEFNLSPSWAHFRSEDGVTFSARRVFPEKLLNFIGAFAGLTDGVRLRVPEGLKAAVETVNLVFEGDKETSRLVTLTIDPEKIVCKAQSKKGAIVEEVDLPEQPEWEGDVKIQIQPEFLIDVLGKTTHMWVYAEHVAFYQDKFRYLAGMELD